MYGKNHGPRYFHLASVHTKYFLNTPHIFTDPDLDFDWVADDFVSKMRSLSEKYQIAKVGVALSIPEMSETAPLYFAPNPGGRTFTVQEWESQYWKNEIEPNIYRANIDTTLHYFNLAFFKSSNFFDGIRIASPGFVAKHLPWYRSNSLGGDDLEFYKKTSLWSTWLTRR